MVSTNSYFYLSTISLELMGVQSTKVCREKQWSTIFYYTLHYCRYLHHCRFPHKVFSMMKVHLLLIEHFMRARVAWIKVKDCSIFPSKLHSAWLHYTIHSSTSATQSGSEVKTLDSTALECPAHCFTIVSLHNYSTSHQFPSTHHLTLMSTNIAGCRI